MDYHSQSCSRDCGQVPGPGDCRLPEYNPKNHLNQALNEKIFAVIRVIPFFNPADVRRLPWFFS
jgi:hypothetical protein